MSKKTQKIAIWCCIYFFLEYNYVRNAYILINYYMNKIQKVWFSMVSFLILAERALAAGSSTFWINNVNSSIAPNQKPLNEAIQDIVAQVMLFLWLLAVLLCIYWGFMILTAAWDEAKVKKWKTVLFQAAFGLVVIYLAYSLVSFVIRLLFGG